MEFREVTLGVRWGEASPLLLIPAGGATCGRKDHVVALARVPG